MPVFLDTEGQTGCCVFTSAAQAGVLCEVAASAGRHLQVLRADGCSVSDAVLGALAAHCPSLRVLSLVGCRGVTDAGLAMLAAGCPRCDAEQFAANTCRLLGLCVGQVDKLTHSPCHPACSRHPVVLFPANQTATPSNATPSFLFSA